METSQGNGRAIFRISASAEKDIKNLPPGQQKHIAEQLKLAETLNMRKVAGVRHGDLYRLRFSGVIRAAVKKDDHYYVIFHVGRKTDIENLYATYRRSEVCREARGAVPLEASCLKPHLVSPSPESLIADLKAELDARIARIEKTESDLTDALGVLDLADRERQEALENLQASVSENSPAEQLISSLRTAERRIAELEIRLQTTLAVRIRAQLCRLRGLWLLLKTKLKPAILPAFRAR